MSTEDGKVPEAIQKLIVMLRSDITVIEFDDGWHEDSTNEYVVPCETYLTEVDTSPGQGGWYYGMMIEVENDKLIDHSVGDWTYGHHPEISANRGRFHTIPDVNLRVCLHPRIEYRDGEYDEQGERISKHHWYCRDCGYLQVG